MCYPPEWFTENYYYAEGSTVWSVGVTLYQMLQGSLPFHAIKEIPTAAVSFNKTISIGLFLSKHYITSRTDARVSERPLLLTLLSRGEVWNVLNQCA